MSAAMSDNNMGGNAMSGGGGMSQAPAMSAAMSNGGAMSGGGGMSGDPLRTGMSVNPRQAPSTRDFRNELSAIRTASGQIAQDQANMVVDTAGRLSDQAIDSTGEIAKKLEDSTYTAAANQNVKDAGTSAAQLGQSYNQVGQTADRVAAYNDPAQTRLNEMALGQLYRPDQLSSQGVSADQAQGARVADVGRMQAAQAGGPSDVQGPAGYTADQVNAQSVSGAQTGPVGDMQAARVRRVQEIGTNDIRASAAERGLMREARGNGLLGQLEGQASNDLALGRSLSAEQQRDATQSARAGSTARGLGLGQSAMAAELLNRDRYATQREGERRGFASNVAQQGVGLRSAANQAYAQRQDANAGRTLQADSANQGMAQQRAMQNAQFSQQAGLANQSTALQLGQTNAQFEQQAALANQSAGLQAGQLNQSANARANEFQQQGGLQASLANQQTGLQLGLTNAQLQQQANATSYENSQQSAMANAGYAQQAGLANQQANLNAAQYNSSQNLAAQSANQSANYNANYANQNFLQGVSSQNFSQFQGQQGMLGSLYGQQAGIAQNQYANDLGLAQANVALDPFQRALGSNIPIASQGNAASMIGQSFGNSMTYGSDLFNTNTNMQASIYNSYNNNQSALKGAKLQAGASAAAGSDAMTGSIISGAGSAVAGAAAAVCWVARACMPDRWQAFRRSMLRHAPDGFIAAYCQHGPAIAARITTPLRRLLARVTLRSLERAWS
jgi:hypothetical protein